MLFIKLLRRVYTLKKIIKRMSWIIVEQAWQERAALEHAGSGVEEFS